MNGQGSTFLSLGRSRRLHWWTGRPNGWRGVGLLAVAICGTLSAVDPAVAAAVEWSQFRGSDGNAVTAEAVPQTWNAGQHILWKTELPGPGTSSPVVAGNKVFLTSYSGYGTDRDSQGSQEDLKRHVICIDRTTGSELWSKEVEPVLPEDEANGMLMDHGYASSTPATDGERVYVFFGKTGVLAFDLEGEQLWQTSVGTGSAIMGWGTASSPIVYKDLVIVNAIAESEAIVALDKRTGKEVWKASAAGTSGCWGTPVLAESSEGKTELVLAVPYEIWGLNPDNGKLTWYAEVIGENAMCTSVVASEGVAYCVGGRRGAAAAVRLGGKGDVSATHVLWQKNLGSYVTSPVVHGGHVYWVTDRGIAYCLTADKGETVYEQRLPGAGQVYASAIVANDKLYAVSRTNGTFVLAAQPKYELLAHNEISNAGRCNASPAVADGQLLLRSDQFLYCIGEQP